MDGRSKIPKTTIFRGFIRGNRRFRPQGFLIFGGFLYLDGRSEPPRGVSYIWGFLIGGGFLYLGGGGVICQECEQTTVSLPNKGKINAVSTSWKPCRRHFSSVCGTYDLQLGPQRRLFSLACKQPTNKVQDSLRPWRFLPVPHRLSRVRKKTELVKRSCFPGMPMHNWLKTLPRG